MDEGCLDEVRVEEAATSAVVFLGTKPVIELGNRDAAAAGSPSLKVHAAAVANQLREAIRAEQSKSATLMTILSLALVIFSGMVAIFLVRRAGGMTDRARGWIADNPERVPAIRLRSIEVIRPASLRAALTIGLSAARRWCRSAFAYGWRLLRALFDATSLRRRDRLRVGPLRHGGSIVARAADGGGGHRPVRVGCWCA